MVKIAITGNIASGKSQVEKHLKELGFAVYDADILAHKILDEKEEEIITVFKDYDISSNGKISRKKLGAIVFNNKDLKTKLENIIYPELIKDFEKIFESHKTVFISASQLFEANLQTMFDNVIFIYADDDIRLQRLMSRNNFTQKEALSRLNSQDSQDKKIKKCDYVIKNNADLDSLKQNLKEVLVALNLNN